MVSNLPARRCQAKALRHHGVISRAEARAEGMSSRAIDRRLQSGEWSRLLPGVYALRGSPATFMRRVISAYKWAGDGALMSHSTSATLLGLDGVDIARIELSTPRRLRSERVVVHQRRTAGMQSACVKGVRVTGADQTLLDLARVLALENLELALDSALRLGLTRFDRVKRFFAPAIAGTLTVSTIGDAQRRLSSNPWAPPLTTPLASISRVASLIRASRDRRRSQRRA